MIHYPISDQTVPNLIFKTHPSYTAHNRCSHNASHQHQRRTRITSSIRISGFSVFVFFRHCITLPGIAPTYVLLYTSNNNAF